MNIRYPNAVATVKLDCCGFSASAVAQAVSLCMSRETRTTSRTGIFAQADSLRHDLPTVKKELAPGSQNRALYRRLK